MRISSKLYLDIDSPASFYLLGHTNLITCLTSFFGEKKICQTPKKKSTLVSYGQKWFRNFLSEKSASFKNIHCKGDSINYRNLSML